MHQADELSSSELSGPLALFSWLPLPYTPPDNVDSSNSILRELNTPAVNDNAVYSTDIDIINSAMCPSKVITLLAA